MIRTIRKAACVLACYALVCTAWAGPGDGHDHGESAASAPAAAVLPRFAAVSEAFELVGVVDGSRLTLYLDHAPTNEPVKDAVVALELGGVNVPVHAHGVGEFEATLQKPPAPGVIAVTASVTGGVSDLLAGHLDVHADAHEADVPHDHGWEEWAAWLAGGLAALALAAWIARRVAMRRARAGGVR